MAKKKQKSAKNIPTDEDINQAEYGMVMSFNSMINTKSPSASTRMESAVNRYASLEERKNALFYMAKKSRRK